MTASLFDGVEADALLLALKDVALSSGSACTSASLEPSYVLKALGVPEDRARGALRFGIGRFNTGEEIDYTVDALATHVERLRAASEAAGTDNVVFLPGRHPNDMGPVFADADALLVHLRDDPLFAITIPSKTQAYLAVGKPILMGVRGDAAALVEAAGAGVAFEPEKADALVAAARGGRQGAPLLLTRPASVPSATSSALRRLSLSSVYVVGGSAVVSDRVVAELGLALE